MKFTKEYKIGLTVFAALLILIFGINFLKGKNLFTKDTVFIAYFDKIDGLKEGSYVSTRGFKVGVVKDIHFDGELAQRMKVTFLINENIKFSDDSKVRIYSMDLMGTRGLDILAGTSKDFKKNGDEFVGEIEGDFKDELGRQIAPLKNKTERLLSSIDSILISVQSIVDVDAQNKIKQSLNSVASTLQNLSNTSQTINTIVSQEASSMSNLISNAESVSANLKKNNDNISNVISNLSLITDTLKSGGLTKGMEDLRVSIENIKKISSSLTTNNGSMGAIINERDLYNNMNETVSNLNRVVLDLEKNPGKYIRLSVVDFGGKKKQKQAFAVVAFKSDMRINDSQVKKDLEEMFFNGKYLYVIKNYSTIKKAEKALKEILFKYPKAFIQKITR